jgi:hypothetical protein
MMHARVNWTDDLVEGDTVFIHCVRRSGASSYRRRKVTRIMPTQFMVEGRRFYRSPGRRRRPEWASEGREVGRRGTFRVYPINEGNEQRLADIAVYDARMAEWQALIDHVETYARMAASPEVLRAGIEVMGIGVYGELPTPTEGT